MNTLDTASVSMGALRASVSHGFFTLTDSNGIVLLRDCWAGIVYSDGTYLTTEGASCEATEAGTLLICQAGGEVYPEVRWRLALDETGTSLAIEVQIENTTSAPVAIERIDVLVAPSGYGQAPIEQMEVAQMGWQSWSRATIPVPVADAYSGTPPITGPLLPLTEAERLLSPWMALLHVPNGRSMLAGFTSARDQQSVLAIQPARSGHRCTASSYPEGVPLQPGATLHAEHLRVIFNQPDDLALERYAQELATSMQASPWPQSISGWASWYHFFTELSEQDVIRNVDALSAQRSLPIEYLRVDDAYQAQVGDWLVIKETFPRGMRALADDIHAAGFKAGIWIAPFLLSENSATYTAHPDWVVRDGHGVPIDAFYNWGARNYVLDTTHPEALAWLRQVISTMLDEWGYEYLMVDFVYAAAIRGKRYDEHCTSVQAYRRGMQLIREVVAHRYLLACGAPFAPSVGLANGVRIDPDIAPSWQTVREPMRDAAGSNPAILNAMRSTLAHNWMHGHLWINDPDCLTVRAEQTELTLPEIETWTTVIALSGGVVQLSDDVSRLDAERVALASRILPPLGQAALPLGPTVESVPTRASLTITRPWETWLVAAFFNLEEEPQAFRFDPLAWNMPGSSPFHVFDLWSGEYLGLQEGSLPLSPTPAHGVKLLSIHADRGRPQVVGSTLHLLGGAVELGEETWVNQTLSLHLRCPGEHTGAVFISVPQSYEPLTDQEQQGTFDERTRVIMLPVRLVEQADLALRFIPR